MSNPYDYYDLEEIRLSKKLNKKNREPYVFTISATNSVGTSQVSSPTTTDVLPNIIPSSPVITKTENVALNSGRQCNVYFNTSTDNGGTPITGYTATAKDNSSGATFTSNGQTSPINITGLTNGSSYTISMYATNSIGNSSINTYNVSFIPFTYPKTVTNLTSSFSDDKINITFTPPIDNGGYQITNYNIQYGMMTINTTNTINIDSYGTLTATDKNTFTLTNQTKDTSGNISFTLNSNSWLYGVPYPIYITSCNLAGCSGRVSTTVTPVKAPVKAPGQVTNVSASSNENGKSTVVFTPPLSSLNSPITNITIISNPGNISQSIDIINTGGSISGVSSPATFDSTNNKITVPITGLTNGTSYTFTIIAKNFSGLTSSVTTNSVIPATIPESPVNLTASSDTGSVKLSFKVPSNNGQNITSYILRPYYTTIDPSGKKIATCDKPITITDANILNSTAGTTVNYNYTTNDRKTFDTTAVTPSTTTFPNCYTEPYSYMPLKKIKNKKSNCCWFVFLLFVIICFLYYITVIKNKKKIL